MADDYIVKLDAKEVKEYLRKVMGKIKYPARILKPISIIYALKDIDEHFRKEEGKGGKWKPRSEFTQDYYRAIQAGEVAPPKGQSRAQYNPANKILQMTGALKTSFKPSSVTEHNRDSVMIRSNIDYSGIHNKGGMKEGGFSRVNIPARPFMWMSDKAMKNMAKALLKTIMG